jgi:UDP-glucuronate decarboxylase
MRNKVVDEDLKYIASADLNWRDLDGKTVLITGASGFLPSYLVEMLLYLNRERGYNINVIGLVRSISSAQERFSKHNSRNLRLVEHDVCSRFDTDQSIDYIIHAASQATPKVFGLDPVGTITPNVLGTANLLELARQKKVKAFIFFSTSGVHGYVDESLMPIKENCSGYLDFTKVSSCYIESKRMGENMCMAWMHQHAVPVKIIRPSITYGPGIKLDDGRSFADFISNILNNEDIVLYSDGKVIRNFCYVADAVLGFFMVILKGTVGEAYHVASQQEISIIDLASYLVKEVFPERKLEVVMKSDIGRNFLRTDYPKNTVDITKLKNLGWIEHYPLSDGFRRTVESYQIES